ncbi:MAG: HAD hydrolase-like protein, partial [Nanoarchaeota archaeon]
MYKLILFDFDGTIADTINVGIPIFNKLARKHNFLEIKSIDEVTQFSLDEFIKKHKISRILFPFYFREFLKLLKQDIAKVKIYKG